MKKHTTVLVAGAVLMLSALPVFAQDSAPPASRPQAKPADAPPSLDDLLGVDKEKKDDSAKANEDAAAKDNQEELQRQLNEADVADAFEQAIQKMSLSAAMLDNQFDTGLGTQRVQEDIIAKLAQLIDQAKKSKSKSKSSSSSSGSQSKQQQSDQASRSQSQKKDGQAQQQKQGNQRNNNPSDSGEGDPPELQQGDVNTVIDETRSEWGNLPQRVREMLMQGRKEKFSSLYQQLTQEYYKRLAEENAP